MSLFKKYNLDTIRQLKYWLGQLMIRQEKMEPTDGFGRQGAPQNPALSVCRRQEGGGKGHNMNEISSPEAPHCGTRSFTANPLITTK